MNCLKIQRIILSQYSLHCDIAWFWLNIKKRAGKHLGESGESRRDTCGRGQLWTSLSLIKHVGSQGLKVMVANQITDEVYKAAIDFQPPTFRKIGM